MRFYYNHKKNFDGPSSICKQLLLLLLHKKSDYMSYGENFFYLFAEQYWKNSFLAILFCQKKRNLLFFVQMKQKLSRV